jgi:enterochelin esterase-like enzyme
MKAFRVFGLMVAFVLLTCLQASAQPQESGYTVTFTAWTAKMIEERKTKEGSSIWRDGDELTMVYQGVADSVSVCCGIQHGMLRVLGSDWWVFSAQVPRLDELVLTYGFFPTIDGKVRYPSDQLPVWRGPKAPVEPKEILVLRMFETDLESQFLKAKRGISVYLPLGYDPEKRDPKNPIRVVYMADGESAREMAQVLEPLIREKVVPPVMIVGMHAASDDNGGAEIDGRGAEYLQNQNSPRYVQHEKFVLEEVIPWAEKTYGASSRREDRAVFGYSNGGGFAATISSDHPDVFGFAFPFSPNVVPNFKSDSKLMPAYFMAAGLLESYFLGTARNIAGLIKDRKGRFELRERMSGHDFVMWREEFVNAIVWAFKP